MKKIIFSSIISLLASILQGQVAIGKTSVTNSSVSLEFGTGDRGLLLPWVNSSTALSSAVDGTLIYDVSDKKVKYKKDGSWFDLSVDGNGAVDTTLQDGLAEKTTAKTVIGSNVGTDTISGILVLSDSNKAMVLPKVASPHLNIIKPDAGMLAYDINTKQLAVFNGVNWSFWKAQH